MLVHGTVTDYRYWAAQIEPLSASHRVIAVSLRHFYPELWDGQDTDFSVDQHARDLAVFIRRLGAGPVHLVGHSYGADVAFLVARREPELLRTLTLADPAPLEGISPSTTEALAEVRFRKVILGAAVDRLANQDIDGGLASYTDAVVGAGTWRQVPEQMRAGLRENAWTIKSLLSAASTTDACADAAAIRAPVLLITGQMSPRAYGAVLEGLMPCLKNRRLATIPNASHTMNRMNPKAFNGAFSESIAAFATLESSEANEALDRFVQRYPGDWRRDDGAWQDSPWRLRLGVSLTS